MKNEPLVIRKRGEDGTKVISVRLPQEIVDALDRIAAESNHSRNEIINIILSYGIENLPIL